MPVLLLERLPLPSLQTYTTFSLLILACAFMFAHQNVSYGVTLPRNETHFKHEDKDRFSNLQMWDAYFINMVNVLMTETWCIWALINMAYCSLILFGKGIQNLVFGALRVSEQQHMRDKFWNFVFYKFIFIFGVMNVQNMDEVVMWCGWFSILGFLHLLTQLCKDRFEYLSFSPTTPRWTHIRVLMLLLGILFLCGLLITGCVLVGLQVGLNTFAFMVAECVLLIINTLYVLTRYGIHLLDINREGIWENRSIYVYYTELIYELSALSVDFTHHLHMLIWGNIFLSMASLVICMQLRYLFYEFQRRIKRHKNYRRVVNSMEAKFPIATAEEFLNSDDCAICWDKMETARKLPCGHLFHSSCLRSWLEQDTTCPTCRMSLNDPGEEERPVQEEQGAGDAATQRPEEPNNQTTNHFFHFDGSRYVSWLPSFSVEVTHTQFLTGARRRASNTDQTSQLDHMARQVQAVFPHVALNAIHEDLQGTYSVEQTIENILEGRLISPTTNAFAPSPVFSDTLPTTNGEEPVASAVSAPNEDEEMPRHNESSHRINANFIMDDNIPNLGLNSTENDDPVAGPLGIRFSKSSSEREQLLMCRKETMLEHAKKKYLSKLNLSTSLCQETADTNTIDDDDDYNNDDDDTYDEDVSVSTSATTDRRELAYLAARRRMNHFD